MRNKYILVNDQKFSKGGGGYLPQIESLKSRSRFTYSIFLEPKKEALSVYLFYWSLPFIYLVYGLQNM